MVYDKALQNGISAKKKKFYVDFLQNKVLCTNIKEDRWTFRPEHSCDTAAGL